MIPTSPFIPLDDRLVVLVNDPASQTAGGIIIPDAAQEKPSQALVVAVGPGHVSEATGERFPLDVEVGDFVVLARYAGVDIDHEGQTFTIISARDVLAKVE